MSAPVALPEQNSAQPAPTPPVLYINPQDVINQAIDAGKQAATGVVNQAVGGLQTAITTVETNAQQALAGHNEAVNKRFAALEAKAEAGLAHLGQTVEVRAETDPWITRILVAVGSVGLVVVASVLTWQIVDGALHGNQEALAIVAAVGAVATPLVAAVVRRFLQPSVTVPVSSLPLVNAPPATTTAILQPGQMTAGLVASTPASTTLTVGN